MKKYIPISLIGTIIVPIATIVSCGNNKTNDKIDLQPIVKGSFKKDILNKKLGNKKIGFVNYNGADDFMKIVQKGIENAGFEGQIQTFDAQNDQSMQNQRIDTYITSGVEGLNINLVEPASAINVINKAKKANLPIVLVNKEAPKETRKKIMNSYSKLVYIGSKPSESGEMQASLIYKDLEDGIVKDRDNDKKIDYVVLGGQQGHADAIARSKFVRKKLYELINKNGVSPKPNQVKDILVDKKTKRFHIKKNLGIEKIKNLMHDHSSEKGVATFVSSTGESNWSIIGGQKVIQALITQGIKLDFISGNNDSTALGGYKALKVDDKPNLKNYSKEAPNKNWVPTYGIDANPTAITSIKNGELAGTVKQDGSGIGKASIAALAAMILGADIDEYFKTHKIKVKKDKNFDETRAYRVPYEAISRKEIIELKI